MILNISWQPANCTSPGPTCVRRSHPSSGSRTHPHRAKVMVDFIGIVATAPSTVLAVNVLTAFEADHSRRRRGLGAARPERAHALTQSRSGDGGRVQWQSLSAARLASRIAAVYDLLRRPTERPTATLMNILTSTFG